MMKRTTWIAVLSFTALAGCGPPAYPPAEPAMPPLAVPREPEAVSSTLETIQFTIQVGAFSTSQRAARYAVHLQSNGLDAYYFIDADGLYKVRFQRFDTKAAARSRAAALKEKGFFEDFFIVHPSTGHHSIEPGAALRGGIVRTARRFIGTPYRWGGASARSGFDCSGLAMTVYRLNGLELPRNANAQYRSGKPVFKRSLQAGDLVFFATGRGRRVSHVGIYSGRGKFIHAPGRGKSIRVASLTNSYFKPRYVGARRYF